MPVGPSLRALLATVPKVGPFVLTSTRDKPWSSMGFDTLFGRAKDCDELRDLRVHDLRGTSVLRMGESGATIPEIIAITGHRIDDATRILESYLPRSMPQAKAAVAMLEDFAAKRRALRGV